MSYVLRQDAYAAPVLETERLVLRLPQLDDLTAMAAFWASERSHMMGGPWTTDETVTEFQGLLDQWAKHGFSLFTVTLKGSDNGIGGIGPFFPDSHPEPELGWSLWNAAYEGQGLAREALIAARAWFFAATDYVSAVSYTHPENARSHKLAEAVGATVDPTAPCPYPPPVRIYRHQRGLA